MQISLFKVNSDSIIDTAGILWHSALTSQSDERLVTVLRVAVRQHYGIDSEKLAKFGLQPFRGRRRKATEPPVIEKPKTE